VADEAGIALQILRILLFIPVPPLAKIKNLAVYPSYNGYSTRLRLRLTK
jgi:hypothetical protein